MTTSDLVLGHLKDLKVDETPTQLEKPLTYIMFHIGDTPFDQVVKFFIKNSF